MAKRRYVTLPYYRAFEKQDGLEHGLMIYWEHDTKENEYYLVINDGRSTVAIGAAAVDKVVAAMQSIAKENPL